MTGSDFDLFLLCSSGLCLLMAIFNAVRAKAKGSSNYFMSAAFLCVGAEMMAYRAQFGNRIVIGIGAKNAAPGGHVK